MNEYQPLVQKRVNTVCLTPCEVQEKILQERQDAAKERERIVQRVEVLAGKFLELVELLNDRTILGAIPQSVRARANNLASMTRDELKRLSEE